MHRKRMLWGMTVAAGIAATANLAVAEKDHSEMPSIVIEKGAPHTPKQPLGENERDYWRCVLEHLKGVQDGDVVDVIQAACRALYGSN